MMQERVSNPLFVDNDDDDENEENGTEKFVVQIEENNGDNAKLMKQMSLNSDRSNGEGADGDETNND